MDRPEHLPSYYDDLDETLAEAWRLVGRGSADRRSPVHTPAIATTGLDGRPQVRTVVLRAADPVARTLRFHTDVRSGKYAELLADPRIAVLGYDPGRKIQLRFSGLARVHRGDEIAASAWSQSRPMSQVCYTQATAPGAAMPASGSNAAPLAEGYDNFSVVSVQVAELDWLYLAHAGHRRARFSWVDGMLHATWLAP